MRNALILSLILLLGPSPASARSQIKRVIDCVRGALGYQSTPGLLHVSQLSTSDLDLIARWKNNAGAFNGPIFRSESIFPAAKTDEQKKLADRLVATLTKVETYEGEVYRWGTLNLYQLKYKYIPGKTIVWSHFAGATVGEPWNRFAHKHNVLFKIRSKTARDIRDADRLIGTTDLHEPEVLFLPGSQFRVISIDWKGSPEGTRPLVELEEVTADSLHPVTPSE